MRETITEIMEGVKVLPGTKPKKVAHNTVRYTNSDGAEVIRLHHTDIILKNKDGTVTLDTGGWKTPTTKDRLNRFSPVRVYSKRGTWFVDGEVPFYDGLTVAEDGTVPREEEKRAEHDAKATRKLIGEINKFVKKLDDLPELPEPGAGDCWFCAMFDREKVSEPDWNHHKASGPTGNSDHLMSHIEEGYIHGWLLANALTWAGYRNPGLIFRMEDSNLKAGREPKLLKNALRRYLKRKLGVG